MFLISKGTYVRDLFGETVKQVVVCTCPQNLQSSHRGLNGVQSRTLSQLLQGWFTETAAAVRTVGRRYLPGQGRGWGIPNSLPPVTWKSVSGHVLWVTSSKALFLIFSSYMCSSFAPPPECALRGPPWGSFARPWLIWGLCGCTIPVGHSIANSNRRCTPG